MEKIVDFKIIAKENENITLTGCVDINTIDDDEPDFEYANSQEFYTPQRYWNIQAETSWKLDEEEQMIRENICNKVDADVCGDYSENAQCLWDFQDENKTIERGSYYLIINEGAKFEVEYEDYNDPEWDAQYYQSFKLFFNGEQVYLDDEVYFCNPYTYEESKLISENGEYIVELPKIVWEDPDETEEIASIMEEYKKEFERIYIKSLISQLGVFGEAYEFIKEKMIETDNDKKFNESYLQEWANATEEEFESCDILELSNMTSDDVKNIIKEDYEEEEELRRDAARDHELAIQELERELF